jgi:CubicO group peptidase (beta-lactamase class C family)
VFSGSPRETAEPFLEEPAVRRPSGRVAPPSIPYSTPEQQGMDSNALATGIQFLIENRETYRVHSVVVVRNGRLVLDARFYPFSRRWKHDMASVTKSWTSTLIGMAIDMGSIENVDEPVLGFFPDYTVATPDPRKERMTIEHLLSMRSGFECDPDNSEITLTEMTMSDDWVQFTLDLPMAHEPGQRYVYCSPNVHLLTAILQRATGITPLEFARRHLLNPLGIVDANWPTGPDGVNRGWGDFHLKPFDMTKLGLLYLNDGKWHGKQIVSAEWVETATVSAGQHVPGWPADAGYSYLWYYDGSLVYAAGRGGQRVHIYPEEDLVVGLNAGSGSGDYYQITLEYLEDWVLGAIVSDGPLEPDPEGVALLRSREAEAAASNEGPPQPVPPHPPVAATISGRSYELDDNIYGLDDLRLTFEDEAEALLEVSLPEVLGATELGIVIGLDDTYRFSTGRFDAIAAAKGSWASNSRFSVLLDELALVNLWRWDFKFDGDEVTIFIESLAGGELPATVTGRMAP